MQIKVLFAVLLAIGMPQKLIKASQVADVNIVGYLKFANGIGRHTITWVDTLLESDVAVHIVTTRKEVTSLIDIPDRVAQLYNRPLKPSPYISILTDVLWTPDHNYYYYVPQTPIKLAFSLCESTKIPARWVWILNNHFDAVIIADPYFEHVYQASGVKIPIFVLPEAVYLDDFLKEPVKTKAHDPFTFGVSASLSHNKNVEILIDAFKLEFGDDPSVKLKIHTPWPHYARTIRNKVRDTGHNNIEFKQKELSWSEYLKFMKSLDCYALLSRGEGFSITPREAMALGIPVILSNNTAHQTICNSGLIYPIQSDTRNPSKREFYLVDVGDNFDCNINDVRKALRDVYENYPAHCIDTQARKEWAKQYLPKNLAPLYKNMVKPKKVILGNKNEITAEHLMTNSYRLHEKYERLAKIARNTYSKR